MKRNIVAMGDIGCYTLGGLPPYSSLQTCFCMGASVGNALGFAKGAGPSGPKPVGVIGDSTFIHGGIPSLIDMVYKKSLATLMILDNSTTGMTGRQKCFDRQIHIRRTGPFDRLRQAGPGHRYRIY